MYWQCTDESLSPRRKQNHTTKFFTEVTQFYSFILSRRCLRRSGQSRREKNNKICVKIEFYFFSISSKNNVGGSVNHKIKKVWPNRSKEVGKNRRQELFTEFVHKYGCLTRSRNLIIFRDLKIGLDVP